MTRSPARSWHLLGGWWHEVRRAVSWHRRLLAAGLLAGAVATTISALTPAPPASVRVIAAAHDLAGGTSLGGDELTFVALPPGSVPDGALRERKQLEGRVLAAPVRRGETLTDLRLVGPALVTSYGQGIVATPVRIDDAATVSLLEPGDVIDVLAAAAPDASGAGTAVGTARVVAAAVPVLAVPRQDRSAFSGSDSGSGALVVVATTDAAAARLATAAVASRLSMVIRPSGQ